MSAKVFNKRSICNVLNILSSSLTPKSSNFRYNKSVREIRRYYFRTPSHYFSNAEERLGSTQAEPNSSKSWLNQYKALLHQIDTHGIDRLEDKFIPIKGRKQKAEGDTSDHFLDFLKVKVIAGNGGDGCINFQQVFLDPTAGPAGGDGGNGGHVLLKATRNKKSLNHIQTRIVARPGENGRSKDCHGKSAPDLLIEVPVGTIVKNNKTVIARLLDENDIFIAARGGAGGKGNSFFTNSVDQAPKIAEFGGLGEIFSYELELQTMADIGLIGFPNAGKSTLLRSVSRARPKVASYPFTTLNPHVGMVLYEDLHQIAIADIPGLVEGSHCNEGLGMAFLKHIQRCSCLLYVLDAADEEDPLQQLSVLKNELEIYEKGLSDRPHAVVLNKMDLPKAQENLPRLERELRLPVIPVSAKLGHNTKLLLAALRLLADANSSKDVDPSV